MPQDKGKEGHVIRKKLLALAVVAGLSVGALHAQVLVGGGFTLDLWSTGSGEDSSSNGTGAHVFVSGQFFEASLALMGVRVEREYDWGWTTGEYSYTALDLTLLGRYPFFLGRVALSPQLGIGAHGFRFIDFRILAGAGVDVYLVRNIFLRGNFLGFYRMGMGDFPLPSSAGFQMRLGVGFWL